jgi:hypothetical protein
MGLRKSKSIWVTCLIFAKDSVGISGLFKTIRKLPVAYIGFAEHVYVLFRKMNIK